MNALFLSFASHMQPWHPAPSMTSGKYKSFFPLFFFLLTKSCSCGAPPQTLCQACFFTMHCVRRQSTNKELAIQESVKSSFPYQHFDTPKCYAIRHWCFSVLQRASFPSDSLQCFSRGDTAISNPSY